VELDKVDVELKCMEAEGLIDEKDEWRVERDEVAGVELDKADVELK